ncbi:putative AUT2/APG4/ATG4 cysteine peptidase [Leptomonas seymouri]|uniref:Cysteine protease n=1 Tax=Leptomonas seymouri TaxID=5684 RepID=A0A0N1IIY5_LEPSE|nr:putative AUT2/APG4/ATG4 cysteine peptidase [Leptomonas seymouri]|eukprot:KPI84584.1 putative AUT2/APG4/ATG4 cysteine peptidase [Leptomonas seymouri]
MSSSKKVAESTPCIDSGSILKYWFNPGKLFRTNNKKLQDVDSVVVVGSGTYSGANMTAFVDAGMRKLLYFSYRNCFPKLPNGSSTDTRWGCLIRTTQMLCGTALLRYHCKGAAVLPQEGNEVLKKKVSKLFMDLPSAPLGIHRAEEMAHGNSVKYASMLSPTEAAIALGAALIDCYNAGGDVPYTICCSDRNINAPTVEQKLCEGEHVFLLIPVVLGISPISEKYQTMLLKFLDMSTSCGIAGGHKQASYYMFGHQGKSVFFLDPHYIQTAYTSEKRTGLLTGSRGNLSSRYIDPCMVLGFYLHTPEDFATFLRDLAAVNSLVAFPLLSVCRSPNEYLSMTTIQGTNNGKSPSLAAGDKKREDSADDGEDTVTIIAFNPLQKASGKAHA